MVAVEVSGVIDENHADASFGCHVATRIRHEVAEADGDDALRCAGFDAAIARHHDVNLMAEAGEGTRKGADHVSQPAGFGERNRFRGHHQHPHPNTLTPFTLLCSQCPVRVLDSVPMFEVRFGPNMNTNGEASTGKREPEFLYDRRVAEQGERPARPQRAESREAAALRAIKADHPELGEAVDMHLELVELFRRVQGRVTLPSLAINADVVKRHVAEVRPLLRFEDIPLDLT